MIFEKHTSQKLKKGKFKFEPRRFNLNNTEISKVISVHVEGVLFDLKEEKLKFKEARKIRIPEYKVTDYTAIIKLEIFGDLIDKVTEKSAYKISYLRVAIYHFKWYLKTTDNLSITVQPGLNIEVTSKKRRWKQFNQYQ